MRLLIIFLMIFISSTSSLYSQEFNDFNDFKLPNHNTIEEYMQYKGDSCIFYEPLNDFFKLGFVKPYVKYIISDIKAEYEVSRKNKSGYINLKLGLIEKGKSLRSPVITLFIHNNEYSSDNNHIKDAPMVLLSKVEKYKQQCDKADKMINGTLYKNVGIECLKRYSVQEKGYIYEPHHIYKNEEGGVLSIPFINMINGVYADKESGYEVDNNSMTVSFVKIIKSEESKSAKELYNLVEQYFTQTYISAKDVIDIKNKEELYIVGKGIYKGMYRDYSSWTNTTDTYDATHMIRVDCRDGRVRVILTVLKITQNNEYNHYLNFYYPFREEEKKNPGKHDKEIVYNTIRKVQESFKEIEEAINKKSSLITDDDW